MKLIGITVFFVTALWGFGQDIAAEQGRKYMYEALTKDKPAYLENVKQNLERGPWEALAYLEKGSASSQEDLQEAVADYYHYSKGVLDVRLRNPGDFQSYNTKMELAYNVGNGYSIALRKPGSARAELTWQILYLDENYLALDMGDVRVFFIHTQKQD